jgi:molecular chaperone DnaK
VYGAEKMLQDMGAKLASGDKAAVDSAIEQLKNAISSNDIAAMNSAMEQLTQAQHRAAEALYKTAGATAGPEGSAGSESAGAGGSQGSAGPQGDVIDAEVVDEEKK